MSFMTSAPMRFGSRFRHFAALTQPLAPGEHGFVAVTRGQPNLVEVFAFAVD
jgi:hypothetical protein